MAVPSAPVIRGIALTEDARVGAPVSVTVTWDGFPRAGATFQWRVGETAIPGQISASYVPAERMADLNCLVSIDNGRGTAMSASGYAVFTVEPEGPSAFTTGFSEGYQ